MTVIQIGSWKRDEDNPIFPVGANPKQLVFCPNPAPGADLIPNHRYLFKRAEGWKAGQVWSEYIAYRLSLRTGVHVPRSFMAVDENNGEMGTLIEFFYGYPGDEESLRFNHGSDLTRAAIKDKKRGRPHGCRYNVQVCGVYVANAAEWWGAVLAFDALIGNTDRHPDNWGVLVRLGVGTAPTYAMAPAFDNATSLAYEIQDRGLPALTDDQWFERYLGRGTHHCGFFLQENKPAPHFELCEIFKRSYPDALPAMQDVLNCAESYIAEVLNDCAEMDVPSPFLPARVGFLTKLLNCRRDALERVLK